MTYHEILNTILFNIGKILKVTILSVIIIFLVLYFIYPLTYRADVTVLPPETKSSMNGLGSLLGTQDFSSLLMGGASNASSQLYMEVIKSRSAAEYVVKKNNLIKYYNAGDKYEAIRKLRENLSVEVSKEGIITLSVEVKTPVVPMIFGDIKYTKKMAANISNSFVDALDKINREKLSSKARQAREYIELQLVKTKAQLDSVENTLMFFQKTNKAISLPEQVNAAIQAAAQLKAEIIKTEVQVGLMQSNLKEDSRELMALRSKLDELQNQYSKMEMGNQDYLVAFKEVPELGRQLASLIREVKIQNEVYIMLQQQYYKEKIQENRDIPTVEVLDEAIPPQKASGPRVVFNSVLAGVFIFLLMSLILVFNEKKPGFSLKKN